MAFQLNGTAGPITGHNDEVDGCPAGGHVSGVGFHIDWQATPLGDGPERAEPTGAFVEDVILACIQRVKFYQGDDEDGSGHFRCTENELTIAKLTEALDACYQRTHDRERRNVEGSHQNDHAV